MSVTDQLTKRQMAVFEFIRDQIMSRGYGPTVREIGAHFEISSPNGVMCHLRALEKKGLLQRVRQKDRAVARAIELAPELLEETRGLPMVGAVAAGPTTLAWEQSERVDFGQIFAKKGQFVLKVKGDSMIEAHIEDGDFVVAGGFFRRRWHGWRRRDAINVELADGFGQTAQWPKNVGSPDSQSGSRNKKQHDLMHALHL